MNLSFFLHRQFTQLDGLVRALSSQRFSSLHLTPSPSRLKFRITSYRQREKDQTPERSGLAARQSKQAEAGLEVEVNVAPSIGIKPKKSLLCLVANIT